MKLSHIILTAVVIGGAFYFFTQKKAKKQRVIKDRGWELTIEED